MPLYTHKLDTLCHALYGRHYVPGLDTEEEPNLDDVTRQLLDERMAHTATLNEMLSLAREYSDVMIGGTSLADKLTLRVDRAMRAMKKRRHEHS